jgi:hypothetical protein
MKLRDMSSRHQQMIRRFAGLPKKILSCHDIDNVTEFVLHALCDERCLDLPKAAYFIDNPAFDCLKGVAGFDKHNKYYNCDLMWDEPTSFSKHMLGCNFNQKVRSIERPSAQRNKLSPQALMEALADELAIRNPAWHGWDAKHDNFAIVIFEQADQQDELQCEVVQLLCLLGFCPVFLMQLSNLRRGPMCGINIRVALFVCLFCVSAMQGDGPNCREPKTDERKAYDSDAGCLLSDFYGEVHRLGSDWAPPAWEFLGPIVIYSALLVTHNCLNGGRTSIADIFAFPKL